MGPPLCSGGYGWDRGRMGGVAMLQWGHHFAVVDTVKALAEDALKLHASMGPPLCSGGYVQEAVPGRHGASQCFNEATTLQWWIREHGGAVGDRGEPASMGPPLCSGGYPWLVGAVPIV